jgi:hypothetical protein
MLLSTPDSVNMQAMGLNKSSADPKPGLQPVSALAMIFPCFLSEIFKSVKFSAGGSINNALYLVVPLLQFYLYPVFKMCFSTFYEQILGEIRPSLDYNLTSFNNTNGTNLTIDALSASTTTNSALTDIINERVSNKVFNQSDIAKKARIQMILSVSIKFNFIFYYYYIRISQYGPYKTNDFPKYLQ